MRKAIEPTSELGLRSASGRSDIALALPALPGRRIRGGIQRRLRAKAFHDKSDTLGHARSISNTAPSRTSAPRAQSSQEVSSSGE